jgi:serine/threonine protein kinase
MEIEFEPQTKIGPYMIIQPLGKGANATVYSAIDEDENVYVLKATQYHRNPTYKMEQKKIIQNEIDCLKKIRSSCKDNYSCYEKDFEWNNHHILVLKDDPGYINLEDYLKKNIPNPSIIEQMEYLVKNMHRKGFTHGDLNLSNFIIDPSTLHLRLIDFAKCDEIVEEDDKTYDLELLNYNRDQLIRMMNKKNK